jgi:hypothetical protein
MSNENQNENVNDNERGGSAKGDADRATRTAAPKSGQQSQGESRPAEKAAPQQGGSDHKSGQQSQGGSSKEDVVKQADGSANSPLDPKRTKDTDQKAGTSK